MATQLNPFSPLTIQARTKNFSVHSKWITINSNSNIINQPKIENLCCSATKESSTATVTEKKEEEEKPKVSAKPKKLPTKPLPELMQEEVIPSLKSTLESQEDLSQIEISFQDNRLEGSFMKGEIPHCFWAFFPDGNLTGAKGFAISSYGSEASTVEPFLIDLKKITAKHVIFWVLKRLAAQDIILDWKKENEEDQSTK